MKNIIFIAPPLAGKGTQSNILKERFGYNHFSTGAMLRESVESDSPLGVRVKNIIDKGSLVSDDIIISLMKENLTKDKEPFILDGIPRTLNQAKSLDEIIDDNYEVIYLELRENDAIKRVESRLTCDCGKIYNINDELLKPKQLNKCDSCGKPLEKRNDDTINTLKLRFQKFNANIEPLLEYYKKKNKLHKIDVNRDILEISKDIMRIVAND